MSDYVLEPNLVEGAAPAAPERLTVRLAAGLGGLALELELALLSPDGRGFPAELL